MRQEFDDFARNRVPLPDDSTYYDGYDPPEKKKPKMRSGVSVIVVAVCLGGILAALYQVIISIQ